MPNIAQQDYIIIDWEGKADNDAAKKAEVDAQLRNIFRANPLALLSVLFKGYGGTEFLYDEIISVALDDPADPANVIITGYFGGEIYPYTFSLT